MKLYTQEQLINTTEAIREYIKNYPETFHESMIEKHLKNLAPLATKRTLIIYNTKETTEDEARHLNLEPTVPNINALHRAVMSVLDKNKDLSINIQVDNDVMENVFVTALEGGSNYWYEIQDYTLEIIRSVEPDGSLSVATWKAISEHGVEVDVYDAENEEILGTLTYDSIKDRLQLINDEGQALACMMNLIMDDYDAGDADAVFQYLVMGEVVFG